MSFSSAAMFKPVRKAAEADSDLAVVADDARATTGDTLTAA